MYELYEWTIDGGLISRVSWHGRERLTCKLSDEFIRPVARNSSKDSRANFQGSGKINLGIYTFHSPKELYVYVICRVFATN